MSEQLKNKMLTLRLNKDQEEYIEGAIRLLEDARGLGARKVTKTEAVLILMSFGMDIFNQKFGNPLKSGRKNKAKSA